MVNWLPAGVFIALGIALAGSQKHRRLIAAVMVIYTIAIALLLLRNG